MRAGDRVRTAPTVRPFGETDPDGRLSGEITSVELVEGRAFITMLADNPIGGIWYFTEDDLEQLEEPTDG